MNKEQFYENLMPIPESGCAIWMGSTAGTWSTGYGQLSYNGKQKKAHRLAWELVHGPIPPDLCVLHKCDVPLCCNVEHLFIGTHTDNMRDCARKGRKNSPNGERVNTSRFNAATVKIIRKRLNSESVKSLAREYKVVPRAIRDIKLNRSWKHIK